MTSQEVKNKILNYELSEELLEECLEIDFRKTIIGLLNALYELLINYNKNQTYVEDILLMLEYLSKKEYDIKNIKIFHGEIKKINGEIHRYLRPDINYNMKVIIRRLQIISKALKQQIIDKEASESLSIMEELINDNRNLKIISGLIRDNKDILKIKDSNSQNILYKLLNKYSNLDESSLEEINYLYQVIAIFLNNDDINIEIIRNIDYYLSALDNKKLKHVKQLVSILEGKRHPVLLSDLEKKFNIYTLYPSKVESEINSFRMSHDGAYDFRKQRSFTIDDSDARCLDDAIYLEKNKDGSYTLYVHITYVPSIIPYLSKINRESIKRVETYHLIDGAYCLYPDYISNYLASLLPNNDRYVETGIWLIEPNMTLVEDSFRLV